MRRTRDACFSSAPLLLLIPEGTTNKGKDKVVPVLN